MNSQFNEAITRQPGQCPEAGDLVSHFDYKAVYKGMGEKLGDEELRVGAKALVELTRYAIGDGERVTPEMIVRRLFGVLWAADPRLIRPDGPNLKEVAKHFRLHYKRLADASGDARRTFGLRNSFQSAQKVDESPGGKKRPLSRSGREGLMDERNAETRDYQETSTLGDDVPLSSDEDSEEGGV